MSAGMARQSGKQRVTQMQAKKHRPEKTIEFTPRHRARGRGGSFDAGFSTAC